MVSDPTFAGEMEVTVFYLKNAKADVVAETLDRIFGGGTSGASGGSGGRGGLIGDLAGAALGDAGGGILGSLLGLGGPGGAVTPSGAIQITPDPRLNALVVQAGPQDLEMIEELLKILDQKESPEDVLVKPKPRVIPVVNTTAEDVAELVKQVYQDRLITGGAAGGRQRQPTPQEFIQMLRGSRRGGAGGGGTSAADIQQKMSIGVDSRNNALIVVAPDLLFQEVKELVERIDEAAAETNQTMRVVTLNGANPAAVEQALSALVGQGVQVGRTNAGGRSSGSSRPSTPSAQPAAPRLPPAVLERMRSRFQPRTGSSSSGRSSRSSRSGR